MSHQAFHCSEPASLRVSCLPLFLSILAYEVYFHTEPAEGDAVTQVLLDLSLKGSVCVCAEQLHLIFYPIMQCVFDLTFHFQCGE